MVLVQVQKLEAGNRYDLDFLQQCRKMVKTKSQIVCGPSPTLVEVTGDNETVNDRPKDK